MHSYYSQFPKMGKSSSDVLNPWREIALSPLLPGRTWSIHGRCIGHWHGAVKEKPASPVQVLQTTSQKDILRREKGKRQRTHFGMTLSFLQNMKPGSGPVGTQLLETFSSLCIEQQPQRTSKTRATGKVCHLLPDHAFRM